MEFDGQLVSELGVKKYMLGYNAKKITSLPIMERQSFYNKSWSECNFGCHGPTYRRHKKDATMSQFIREINSLSPVAAGLVDGVHTSTIIQAELLAGGVERTGEGLGIAGKDKFRQVGAENHAALNLLTTVFKKAIDTEIDYIDNPLTKLIMAIVYEYIGLVPEPILERMLDDGAIKIPDGINEDFVYSMIAKGIVTELNKADIGVAVSALRDPAKKMIAKQVGKKLGVAIAAILAAKITKKIMSSPDTTWRFKKRLVEIRKSARGGGAGVLLGLLKTQGWLGLAARESRSLQASCPKLWQFLRYKLGGVDLLYFVVKEITQEYVDRLSLIEKEPATYLKLMASLVHSGKTDEIFFPK